MTQKFAFSVSCKPRKLCKTSSNLGPRPWCERHGSIFDFTSQTAILFSKKFCSANPVCDVKSRIHPCISHHGHGSKVLLVFITLCLSRLVRSEMVKPVWFWWEDKYSRRKIFEFRCCLIYAFTWNYKIAVATFLRNFVHQGQECFRMSFHTLDALK